MSRVTTFDKPFSRAEMEAALQQLAGRELPNYLEGVTAQVNATQRRKLKSDKAIRKSINNGFAGGVYLSFAAKIENLWKWSARVTDENSDFQRFVAPLRINSEDMFAWISVKNGQEGLRIYSLELVKKEKLGQNLSDGETSNGPNITAEPSFAKILKRLSAPVNKTPLWERAQSSHSVTKTPDAISGQSGVSENINSTDPDGNPLFQGASALGSTTFDASGNYVIQLFRGANLSTLTHETAHVFFLEMERLEREGLADERMLADLAALREWTAAMDDDAALKAEYDRYQKHSAYGGAEFDTLPGSLKEDARSRAKQEMLARF